jgi:pyrroline-5-carboxylate reductase
MSCALLLAGCGKMGGAMLEGWLAAGTVDSVVVVEPRGEVPEDAGVTRCADASLVPQDFRPDVVVFAVKPQVMDEVVPAYARFVRPGTLFVSVAAGRTVAGFERMLGGTPAMVRAMPNTPAAVGRGITAAYANPHVAADQRDLADRLLSAVGEVAWIDEEAQIDAVTAVSGSGPAYVFLLVEAMAEAGRKAGLPAELAMRLARSTVAGSGELLHRSPVPADQLRRNVTSPNGTTQAALDVLMAEGGLPDLLERAVAAAARRSRELAS